MGSNITVSLGTGFFGLLALLFIGLKLTDQIIWSWVWVLSPLWLPLAVVIVIAIIVVGLAIVFDLFSY